MPLGDINALFPVRQRQPHQKLKACHRKLAAGRGFEIALALDRRVRQVVDVVIVCHGIAHEEKQLRSLVLPSPLARP